jgi:hypothetical protein
MPVCPKCKYEYVEGIKVCPDCDLPLKAHLHEEPPEEPEYTDEALITLVNTSDQLEAEIMKGVLDSAGIPAMIQSDVSAMTRAAVVLPNRGLSIIVQESRYQDAMEALRRAVQDGKQLGH